MRFIYTIIVFFIMIGSLHAQIDTAEVYRQLFEEDEQLEPVSNSKDNNKNHKEEKAKKDKDEEKEPHPIYVSLQPSIYFANNSNANYYNGSVRDITLNRDYIIQTIWNNPNNQPIIRDDLFLTVAQYDAVEFSQNNFNFNMRYDIGLMIGFQAFLALKPRLFVMLDFNFVTLNTASFITINVPDFQSPNPDINNTNIKMEVYGKEQRIITSLGMHYIIGKQTLKYYVEGGLNLLMAKANNNFFVTGEEGRQHTWNLMQNTNNTALNTITSVTLGAFAGGGLFFKMNEDFAFELGTAIAMNNVKFPGFDSYLANYQFNIRIIYLAKNSKL